MFIRVHSHRARKRVLGVIGADAQSYWSRSGRPGHKQARLQLLRLPNGALLI
jgi:hypothetical protein